jgi:hypothetical protein
LQFCFASEECGLLAFALAVGEDSTNLIDGINHLRNNSGDMRDWRSITAVAVRLEIRSVGALIVGKWLKITIDSSPFLRTVNFLMKGDRFE